MTTNVNNATATAAPTIKDSYQGWQVKGKNTANPTIDTADSYRTTKWLYGNSLATAREELKKDVTAVNEHAAKQWSTLKKVVLFVPVTLPCMIWNAITSVFSKIASLLGFGAKDQTKTDAKAADQKAANT